MKRLFTSADRMIVGHLAEVLNAQRIPCVVRNQFLAGAAGELPINETWPEIWVMDEGDLPRALKVLSELLGTGDQGSEWTCRCGERLDAQFSECWHCGASRIGAN
jgi:hypothetical protein